MTEDTITKTADFIFNQIESDNKITIDDRDKYTQMAINFFEKKKESKPTICQANKADGYRCTRKCKPGKTFCGKHQKQKFGCFDIENTIQLKKIIENDATLYLDSDNILYKPLPDNKYKIIGKKRQNNEIYYIDT
jgi:hypothetical protein